MHTKYRAFGRINDARNRIKITVAVCNSSTSNTSSELNNACLIVNVNVDIIHISLTLKVFHAPSLRSTDL